MLNGKQNVRVIVKPTTSRLDRWMWEVQSQVIKRNPGNPLLYANGEWKTVEIPHLYSKEFKIDGSYYLRGHALNEKSAIITGKEQAEKYKAFNVERAHEAEVIQENTTVIEA